MKEAFIDVRKQLEKKLKKDRFEHTIGVMYTAASLAMRYHEDIDDAMMAGDVKNTVFCLHNQNLRCRHWSMRNWEHISRRKSMV